MNYFTFFVTFSQVSYLEMIDQDISVFQIPEMTAKEGTNVSITCHIKADSRMQGIMVKWLQDNQTVPKSEKSAYPSSVNGCVFINATLHLQSIRLNHSGMYYCTAHMNVPMLGSVKYGQGTLYMWVSFIFYSFHNFDSILDWEYNTFLWVNALHTFWYIKTLMNNPNDKHLYFSLL